MSSETTSVIPLLTTMGSPLTTTGAVTTTAVPFTTTAAVTTTGASVTTAASPAEEVPEINTYINRYQ